MKHIFLFFALWQACLVQAQEPWLYQNNYDHGFQILESYDGGVVIAATQEGQSETGKIIKLNQSGDMLWEHTFEENQEGLYPLCLVEDTNGDLIIAGQTFHYQSDGGGFVMRLNACGELLWFTHLGVDVQYDVVNEMVLTAQGAVVFNHKNTDQRYVLTKIDVLGNVLWTSPLELENVWAGGADGLFKCKDGGYALVGTVYAPPYFDTLTTIGYLRGVVIKTDSLGLLDWFDVYRWQEDTQDTVYVSINHSLVELENGHFTVLSLNRNSSYFPPLLYELDAEGALLWHKNIAKPDTFYSNSKSVLASDSTLMVVTSAALPISIGVTHIEVYKMDLQGNKLAEFVDENTSTIQRDLRLNPDSSYLYILPGSRVVNGNSWNLYALKLNPYTLELDTFLMEDPAVYDYYCPEGVVDQNFFFPEDSVSLEELQELEPQLKLVPNPAKAYTSVYFDITNFNRSAKIEFRNLQGQLVYSYPILASVGCLQVDVSSYTSGMYLVSLLVDNKLVESARLLVE